MGSWNLFSHHENQPFFRTISRTKALARLWALLNCSATICKLIEKTSLIMSIHQWQKKTKNSWIEFIYTSATAGESLGMIQKQLQAA